MGFAARAMTSTKEQIERLKATAARAKVHAERGLGVAIAVAETGGTAAGFGYVHARYGAADADGDMVYSIATVDADLGAGVAMHAAGFFGAFGKYEEHAHNIGNGALAAYGYRQGMKMGRAALKSANAPPTTTTKGHTVDNRWQPGARRAA